MKTVTFKKGGVHPPEQKYLSSGNSIVAVPLPDELAIPLNQHLGRPALPLVKARDNVTAGQRIGEADGFISAHVHSPVSGTVRKIEKRLSPMGSMEATVVIQVDQEQTKTDLEQFLKTRIDDPMALDSKDLLNQIADAGVVGQGGATFPTHVKLSPPDDKLIDLLIINGAECEPYLTADHRLMLEAPEALLSGIRIVMHILGVQRAIIGIEANKPDALSNLRKLTEGSNFPINVIALKTRYPQGGEKQLVQAVCGRKVPSGKLPFEIGVVVQNVGTMISIHEAVVYGKPVIDRITTVTGQVNRPGNFRVPIGISFSHLIEAAGGFREPESIGAVINGGPMMGKTIRCMDVPVVKGTSGILVFSRDEMPLREEGPCIRCGRCVDTCPMGLLPTALADAARFRQPERLTDVMDCMECGSCAYVCPTNRRLVHWIRIGKAVFRNEKRS